MIKKHFSQSQVMLNFICKFYLEKKIITKLMAGVEGLEPTAPGFGDRCSTN